jgi:hypothetical protein
VTDTRKVNHSATDVAALLHASEKFARWKPLHERLVKPNRPNVELSLLVKDRHWSVMEVAEQWGISTDLVRDIFKDEDGVLIVERPGTRTKRSYSTMRIPESVLERVYNQLSRR